MNIVSDLLPRSAVLLLLLGVIAPGGGILLAQTTPGGVQLEAAPDSEAGGGLGLPSRRLEAAAELRVEEHQRIMGVMPNFNTSFVPNAAPLDPKQKFDLAFKNAIDPFTFVMAGLDAGLSQAQNDFPEYRQGAAGFARRFGASYADTFSSTMLGSAVFPALLKQDPRYFRKGEGPFMSRLWYAVMSEFQCKNDSGRWAPNYSNLLGNIGGGAISNLYYPAADRGLSLTFQRAATLTAEGAISAVFFEFWPDITKKFGKRHEASGE